MDTFSGGKTRLISTPKASTNDRTAESPRRSWHHSFSRVHSEQLRVRKAQTASWIRDNQSLWHFPYGMLPKMHIVRASGMQVHDFRATSAVYRRTLLLTGGLTVCGYQGVMVQPATARENDRLPCSGGNDSSGCVGGDKQEILGKRKGVTSAFVKEVEAALDIAVIESQIMPLENFQRERSFLQLEASGALAPLLPTSFAEIRRRWDNNSYTSTSMGDSVKPPDPLNSLLYASYKVLGGRLNELDQDDFHQANLLARKFQQSFGRALYQRLGLVPEETLASSSDISATVLSENGEEVEVPFFVPRLKSEVDRCLEFMYQVGYLQAFTSGPGLTSWAKGYFVVQLQDPLDRWAGQRLRKEIGFQGMYPHLAASLVGTALETAGINIYTLDESYVQSNPPPWVKSDNSSIQPIIALQEFKFSPP